MMPLLPCKGSSAPGHVALRRFFGGLLPLGLLALAALPVFAAGAPQEEREAKERPGRRPNVLFIISDDLNNAIGCYGDPLVRTPNIDRLAVRGVRFDRAYCQFPLCGPSRNSLLTGLYPNSTGILANGQIFRQTIPSQLSLSHAFRRQGYFAARIGKLYHYNVPRSIGSDGHDDPGSWELELNPAGCDRLEEEPRIFSLTPGEFGGTLSWYASPKSDEHHTDALIAEGAEWVLERCAREAKEKGRPFLVAAGFFRPHTPYVAPRSYFDLYPESRMPVARVDEESGRALPRAALASHKKEQEKLTDELRRQAVQAYFASITFMDAQVGRLLDALERLGLAESTIVVFTSDHGYHLGEHGLWQKMSLFEESARVPLIIAAPGVAKPGGVAGAPVGLIDLYPTLAELCGVEGPSNLQGASLVPLLRDPALPGRGWALTQVTRTRPRDPGTGAAESAPRRYFGYSLRTPRWRYTEWDGGEEGRELYDHERDPREVANLAGDPAQAETVAALSAQLREAVRGTFPPNGKIPELRPGLWAPNLTDP
jgi:arylsulfatase A-like enzyme